MTVATTQQSLVAPLRQAQELAEQQQLGYAGSLSPLQAWDLYQQKLAVIVDIRSAEEVKFVGHIPGVLHVPWASGTALNRNPRFTRELEAKLAPFGGKEAIALLLCRSGKRSVLAAQAATQAGFQHVFNILEGFEGEINAQGQRGSSNGWRYHGLPWEQD